MKYIVDVAGERHEVEIGPDGVTFDGDRFRQQARERITLARHDELIRAADGCQRGVRVKIQDDGIVQAAWALQHGAASAASTQNGDAALMTSFDVNFLRNLICVAEYDEGPGRFPKQQHSRSTCGFGLVEQCFVGGQQLGGRGESEVEEVHGGWRPGRKRVGEKGD